MSNFSDNQSAEILNSVYKNAQMACEASNDVLKKCKNSRLFREISREQERYRSVALTAKNELSKRRQRAEQPPPYDRAMAKMGIAVKTAGNSGSQNLAKIMFNGTTMGIVDMQHTINRARAADPRIIESAKRLLAREQDYCDSLRKYL